MSKKIWILPLFTMPSGHRHAADAIETRLRLLGRQLEIKQIDLLSHVLGRCESWLSRFYLSWIQWGAQSYQRVYQHAVQGELPNKGLYRFYEMMFIRPLHSMIRAHKPDMIFCTHSLPSYLCAKLKNSGHLNIPLINVYTDYCLHHLWASESVDVHLLPDQSFKSKLASKGVSEKRLHVTGIPLDPAFSCASPLPASEHPPLVLITGGHYGTHSLEKLIGRIPTQSAFRYAVLCGKNERLWRKIQQLDLENIMPIRYIANKMELVQLYQSASMVLTKAGGLTLSESLRLMKPTFVYHALPGQEQANRNHLQLLGLIDYIEPNEPLECRLRMFQSDPGSSARKHQLLMDFNQQFLDADRGAEHLQLVLKELI